jgi:putative FmdB family regulatory protein
LPFAERNGAPSSHHNFTAGCCAGGTSQQRNSKMAYYEFECKKCEHQFTVQESFAEHDQPHAVKCPKCGSKKIEQLISSVHVKTSKKS